MLHPIRCTSTSRHGRSHERTLTPDEGAGRTEDYCTQLTSEARIVVDGRPTWVRRSRNNHFLDCEALCAAIGYALNVQRIPEGVSRPGAGLESGGEAPAPEGDALSPLSPANFPAAAGCGAFRQRFASMGHRLNR